MPSHVILSKIVVLQQEGFMKVRLTTIYLYITFFTKKFVDQLSDRLNLN